MCSKFGTQFDKPQNLKHYFEKFFKIYTRKTEDISSVFPRLIQCYSLNIIINSK
jgi:hypothetical protein